MKFLYARECVCDSTLFYRYRIFVPFFSSKSENCTHKRKRETRCDDTRRDGTGAGCLSSPP